MVENLDALVSVALVLGLILGTLLLSAVLCVQVRLCGVLPCTAVLCLSCVLPRCCLHAAEVFYWQLFLRDGLHTAHCQ